MYTEQKNISVAQNVQGMVEKYRSIIMEYSILRFEVWFDFRPFLLRRNIDKTVMTFKLRLFASIL